MQNMWGTPELNEVTQDTHGLSACGGQEAGSSWPYVRKPKRLHGSSGGN